MPLRQPGKIFRQGDPLRCRRNNIFLFGNDFYRFFCNFAFRLIIDRFGKGSERKAREWQQKECANSHPPRRFFT